MRDEKIFTNFKAAIESIRAERYAAPGRRNTVSARKIYSDIKRGLFPVRCESAITEAEVASYIHKAGLVRLDGNANQLDQLIESEKRLRISIMETRRKKEEFDLAKARGDFIPKKKWLAELAIKLGGAKNTAIHVCRIRAAELIELVGGDLEKEQLFIDMISVWIEDAFHEWASVPELHFRIIKPAANGSQEN